MPPLRRERLHINSIRIHETGMHPPMIPPRRPKRQSARHSLAAGMFCLLLAAGTSTAAEPEKPEWVDVPISPQRIDEPSLDVRVFPDAALRHHGDAAPIFLRYAWDNPHAWKGLDTVKELLALPLDELTPSEARRVAPVRFYDLQRAAYASHVDWNYPMYGEGPSASVLLPDISASRYILQGLALQCRADVAEGKIPDAMQKLRIGLGLVHHLQQPPFLVVKTVQASAADPLLNCCRELSAQPEAPNLYWALTALPNPLIDIRPTVDWERRMLVSEVPELAKLEVARTSEEWQAIADRLADVLASYAKKLKPDELFSSDDYLSRARTGLAELESARGRKRGPDKSQSDAEVVVRYFALRYLPAVDRDVRPLLLPPHQAIPQLRQRSAQRTTWFEDAPELAHLSLKGAVFGVAVNVWGLQRRIDALRIVEALRDHAARHDGALPAALDALDLPVPLDVLTNRPFAYRLEDGTAFLSAEGIEIADGVKRAGIHFRIHCR